MDRLRLLLDRLVLRSKDPPAGGEVGEVPADRYTSPERFAGELRVLGRTPSPVAVEAELAVPGACVAVEVGGVPLIVARGDDGVFRAFRNACRHRSTELLAQGAPCTKKAFVCPYHGWTYDLRGRRIHLPHPKAFGAMADPRDGLVPAHAEVRHGLVWAALAPFDLDAHAAPIAGDLDALGMDRLALYRRATREVRGNWKLIVDAFLDGYHIRHLHRDSIYRFFVDALVEAEQAGPHVRALTARRELLQAKDLAGADVREVATPSYVVFPSTVLVAHPDFVSVLTCTPRAADRTLFSHAMLVPAERRGEEAHWAKSFALIDETVFGREDLATVEAIQRGLAAGASETLLFGELEQASLWFHRTLDAAVG